MFCATCFKFIDSYFKTPVDRIYGSSLPSKVNDLSPSFVEYLNVNPLQLRVL